MQWNELSKKTAGIIVVLGVLFAGAVIVIVLILVEQQGGYEIGAMVRDAVKSQRIAIEGESTKIISDRILVIFRPNVSVGKMQEIAAKTGVKIQGKVAEQPNTYIVSLPSATVRQLRQLVTNLKQSADVVDASIIPVE